MATPQITKTTEELFGKKVTTTPQKTKTTEELFGPKTTPSVPPDYMLQKPGYTGEPLPKKQEPGKTPEISISLFGGKLPGTEDVVPINKQ